MAAGLTTAGEAPRVLRFAFCFDRAYALPAAVSLHSLMAHATRRDALYELNIVAGDLDDASRRLLERATGGFANARLVYREPPALPAQLRGLAARKSHYSDALFSKLLLPRIFGDEGRVVALDVDTVYCADAARFHDFPFAGCVGGAPEPMYFGWRGEGPLAGRAKKVRRYFREYSPEERRRMTLNAGVIIYDLGKIAACGAVGKWVEFALANARRLLLPEQDVFNLALDAPPEVLPWGVCRYAPLATDAPPSSDAVQLHYTTKIKPWFDPTCRLADCWFAALASAGLVEDWQKWYAFAARDIYRAHWAKTLFAVSCGRLRFILKRAAKGGR